MPQATADATWRPKDSESAAGQPLLSVAIVPIADPLALNFIAPNSDIPHTQTLHTPKVCVQY